MSTWNPYDGVAFNPFTVTTCLHCGDPIGQPKHGGRPRRYCDKPACRKAGSRKARKLTAERERTTRAEKLRLAWQQFEYDTRVTLETILQFDTLEAAERATKALQQELHSREQLARARNLIAEAERKEQPKLLNFSGVTPRQIIDALLSAAAPGDYLQTLTIQLTQLTAEIEQRQTRKQKG